MPTEAAAAPTAAATEEAMAQEYNSTANMRLLFAGRGHQESDTFRALELARQNADKSLVPVVLELMRFFGTSGMILESLAFLTDVTGPGPGHRAAELEGLAGVVRQQQRRLPAPGGLRGVEGRRAVAYRP